MRVIRRLLPLFPQFCLIAVLSLVCALIANGCFASSRRHLAWRGTPPNLDELNALNPPLSSGSAAGPSKDVIPLPVVANVQPSIVKAEPSQPSADKPKPPPARAPNSVAERPGKPPSGQTQARQIHPPAQGEKKQEPEKHSPSSGDSAIREISSQEALDAFKAGTPFLDARRSADFESGHIRGAHSAPVWESDLESRLIQFEAAVQVEPKAPLVLYCSSGECEDSHLLAVQLRRKGYRNLLLYKDGFPDWESKGRPVSRGAQP